jgi:hypothetical protein
MQITMEAVSGSSQIKAIGYNAESQTLHVQFHNGATYEYAEVPPFQWEALKTADSVGGHFARAIKGKYETKKV